MNTIDLHIHSIASNDGELKPEEIVRGCKANGVSVCAVTDHNSVAATEQAMTMAKTLGLEYMAGIEVDCSFDGVDLHVLGYGIDWQSTDFYELEQSVARRQLEAFSAMMDNLTRLGMAVDGEEVMRRAQGAVPTGELIAEVLLGDAGYDYPELLPYRAGGERGDMPYLNFYLDYFAQNRPAYVKVDYMRYSCALELIMDHGGVPIVAHPGLNLKGNETIVERLLDKGAQGVEVFNNYHDAAQASYFAEVVTQRGAYMTAGSDFHGKNKPRIKLGQYGMKEAYGDYLLDSVTEMMKRR